MPLPTNVHDYNMKLDIALFEWKSTPQHGCIARSAAQGLEQDEEHDASQDHQLKKCLLLLSVHGLLLKILASHRTMVKAVYAHAEEANGQGKNST